MIHHDFTGQQTSFSKPVPKKQGDVPSLFSSTYKSKFMSPVKLTHLPKDVESHDKGTS